MGNEQENVLHELFKGWQNAKKYTKSGWKSRKNTYIG